MDKINEIIDKVLEKIILDKKRHFFYFFFVLFLLLLLTYYWFPIFPGHDYPYHIRRFEVLIDAINNGYFPSYLDYGNINNYGYFPNTFYSDVTLIPFAIIGLFTGTKTAYTIMIYVMTTLCAIFTYQFGTRVFKNHFIAAIAAILFTFSFYKLIDTYERAALGETLCFTFIPLVFWGLFEIVKGNPGKWYILTLGMGLMLFTHPPTSLICIIFIAIFLIIFYKNMLTDKKRILFLIVSVIYTAIFTSYYFLPMMDMAGSSSFYYEHNIIYAQGKPIYEVIFGMFMGILPRITTKYIVGSGIAITLVLILRFFITDKDKDLRRKSDLFLIMGIIGCILVSNIYPWRTFPFSELGIIQFTWRFYILVSFFWSVAGAVYLYVALDENSKRLKIGLPYILIISAMVIIGTGQDYQNNKIADIDKIKYPLYGAGFVPDKIPWKPEDYTLKRGDTIISIKNKSITENLSRKKNILSFMVNTEQPDSLELPLIHYIGYTASLDGQKISTKESKNGLVQIPVNRAGEVRVWYTGTAIQKISWYITLLSALFLCCYIIIYKRKQKKEETLDASDKFQR